MAAVRPLHGEALKLPEERLRKQAEPPHEPAGARDIPEAAKARTRFAQDLRDDSTQDAPKVFSALRRAGGGGA